MLPVPHPVYKSGRAPRAHGHPVVPLHLLACASRSLRYFAQFLPREKFPRAASPSTTQNKTKRSRYPFHPRLSRKGRREGDEERGKKINKTRAESTKTTTTRNGHLLPLATKAGFRRLRGVNRWRPCRRPRSPKNAILTTITLRKKAAKTKKQK